jgi:hypothetical protein
VWHEKKDMSKLKYFSLFLLLLSCSEEKVRTDKAINKWEKTDIEFTESFFIKSFSNDKNLYLLFYDKLVVVDQDLNTKEIVKFVKQPWINPYPILSNNIFGISELKFNVGWPKDSAYFNLFTVREKVNSITLNFSKLRSDINENTNVLFNLDLAAINENNRILMVIPIFTTHTYLGVTFDIENTESEIKLKNKRVFPLNDIKTLELRTMTSIGTDYYLSTYDQTFKIDQNGKSSLFDNKGMIGKPFFFQNKWHMKTYNGFYESDDRGITWTTNNSYKYRFVYPLGIYNNRLYFSEDESQYCKNSIKWTDDLKQINELKIGNETTDSCFTRLKLMDKYLYSLGKDNLLYRVDIHATQQ